MERLECEFPTTVRLGQEVLIMKNSRTLYDETTFFWPLGREKLGKIWER